MQYHLPEPNFDLKFSVGGLGNLNKSRKSKADADGKLTHIVCI
jgi:hypothetical protein